MLRANNIFKRENDTTAMTSANLTFPKQAKLYCYDYEKKKTARELSKSTRGSL